MENMTEKKFMKELKNSGKAIEKKLRLIFYKLKGKQFNLKKIKIYELFDSIEMLSLISEIEKGFKIKLKPEQINEKNFSKMENLINLINEKKK